MDRVRGQTQRIVRPEAKRRRPPRACVQCYRRKIKCGQESPACGRCVKAGHGQDCTYRGESRPDLPSGGGVLGPPVTTGKTSSTLRVVEQTELSTYSTPHAQPPQPLENEGMTHFKGQGTTTKFYGFSYHLNLYQQFPDLRPYIAQIKARHPAIDQLRDEMYSVAARRSRTDQLNSGGTSDREEALRQQIPSRDVTDILIQTYMDRFEIFHRVLHIPEFMTKYKYHWTQPQFTPALYLAQLLLVMAAAASFHAEEPMDVMSYQSIRPLAVRWIEVAEAWLISSSEPPESWSALTTHCLLLIAKRANCVGESALWTATGTLVKWAMAAGYHRESGPTVRLSLFHREMRRRLWATILELDIQASIERGMPPTIRKGDSSTHPILHVDDSMIQESTSVPPLPQSLATWTDTSFQVILQRSVTVRLKVCALANGAREEVEFDEILRLGDELTQAIRDIPVWNEPHASLQHQQATSYTKAMLNLILYQNILVLQIPWAIQTSPTFKSEISRRARLEAASVIINQYKQLINDKIIPESGCRNGLGLATLSICHDLYLSCAGLRPSQSMSTIPELTEVFLSMAERAMEVIGKRVITQFQGLNEYYVVCMAIGLIKSKLWPESQFTSGEEAAERAIRASTLVRSSATALDSPRHSHAGLNVSEPASFQATSDNFNFFSSLFSDDLGFLNQELDLGLFHF